METIDKAIKERLLKNKPNLSDSSIKTYISLLKNLYYKMYKAGSGFDIDKFEDVKGIKQILKDKPPSVRKTYLASLISLLGKKSHIIPDLTDLMNDDAEKAKEEDIKQTKNEKQKMNTITKEEIENIYNELLKHTQRILKINKNTELNKQDYNIW